MSVFVECDHYPSASSSSAGSHHKYSRSRAASESYGERHARAHEVYEDLTTEEHHSRPSEAIKELNLERYRSRSIPTRLLGTETYEIRNTRDLIEERIFPSYAILSHTWLHQTYGDVSEVTYNDMKTKFFELKFGGPNGYKAAGWAKLTSFCNYARDHGFEWAWMDTCCIDKPDIIDTQEAINAMFQWYQNAAICYAHLTGVDAEVGIDDNRAPIWFTRGWTLQELVAPSFLQFVDEKWTALGTRHSLAEKIEKHTRISQYDMENYMECSIAKRLSWAAERETTEVEDEAYCLLGLFGVRMPLIYGEGRRAFTRFQEELLKRSNDDSIFAWCEDTSRNPVSLFYYNDLLAPSIACFKNSYHITSGRPGEFCLTNRGVELQDRPYWILPGKHNRDIYLVELGCTHENHLEEPLAIMVHTPMGEYTDKTLYKRTFGATLAIRSRPHGTSEWEVYDDFLSRHPYSRNTSPVREDVDDRRNYVGYSWAKVKNQKMTFTIAPPKYDFDRPCVLLITADVGGESLGKSCTLSRTFHRKYRKPNSRDKQALLWDGFKTLEGKDERSCYLLHNDQRLIDVEIDSRPQFRVSLWTSPPPFSAPRILHYGVFDISTGCTDCDVLGEDSETRCDGCWNRSKYRNSASSEAYNAVVDHFPIPHKAQERTGLTEKMIKKMSKLSRVEFRLYQVKITVTLNSTVAKLDKPNFTQGWEQLLRALEIPKIEKDVTEEGAADAGDEDSDMAC